MKLLAGAAAGVLVLVAALQFVNHHKVRDSLCALDGLACAPGSSPLSFSAQGQVGGLPEALRAQPLQLQASTALLRRACDGHWTLAFGARIDGEPVALGKVLDGGRACIDVGRDSLHASLSGGQLHQGACIASLGPVLLDWDSSLRLQLSAQVDKSAAAACSALLPASLGDAVAQQLSAPRVELQARYGVAYAQREALPGAAGPAASSAGGWLRQALAAVETAQELRITLPAGSASLSLASKPVAGAAPASPELTLQFGAAGSVLALLPDTLQQGIKPSQPLRLRWNLDHETGRVYINEQPVQRSAPGPRPPGRTLLTAAECGVADTAWTQALYFVEADDRGAAVAPAQMQAVFAALDQAGAGSGALVSVFVHGWQHSAAPGDSYVCDYARLIRSVETMETQAARASGRTARQVLGVYVGWPGKLYPEEMANSTTFWNRLQTADRLGAEGALLRQLIPGLAQRVAAGKRDPRADRRSALIVTGHSMGGRAVFHAVRDGLTQAPGAAAAAPQADLVLLVNPAFSAELYRAIHAQELQCKPIALRLLSFSSEADAVTRQVYPAGQSVTFERAASGAAPFPEHIYTAANFGEFVTHRLRMELLQGEPPRPDGEQSILRGFQRVPAGSDELYADNPVTVYQQPQAGFPRAQDAWYRLRLEDVGPAPQGCAAGRSKVIEVDRRIVPNHGTIFTPPFMEYVVRALNSSALGPQGRLTGKQR